MIQIKSNKILMFPPSYRGFVTMTIDIIQNHPNDQLYTMRLVDSCYKIEQEERDVYSVDENGEEVHTTETIDVKVKLGNDIVRFKTMTYAELDQLATILNVDMTVGVLRENINELFRQGLLLTTQQEAINGEGMYFSEPQDWEIVR